MAKTRQMNANKVEKGKDDSSADESGNEADVASPKAEHTNSAKKNKAPSAKKNKAPSVSPLETGHANKKAKAETEETKQKNALNDKDWISAFRKLGVTVTVQLPKYNCPAMVEMVMGDAAYTCLSGLLPKSVRSDCQVVATWALPGSSGHTDIVPRLDECNSIVSHYSNLGAAELAVATPVIPGPFECSRIPHFQDGSVVLQVASRIAKPDPRYKLIHGLANGDYVCTLHCSFMIGCLVFIHINRS